jgi:DNA-binding PucR family transcriptional regulator
MLDALGLSAGLGNQFSDVTDFARADRQSVTALSLGFVLHPEKKLYFYDRYALFHLFQTMETQASVRDFCHPGVETLAEYDKAHNTRLLEAMRAFLGCGGLALAADHLGVHRNTMAHHIEKIRELTGADLSDAHTVTDLLFSCAAFDYLRIIEASKKRKPLRDAMP